MLNLLIKMIFRPIDLLHDWLCSCGIGFGDDRIYSPMDYPERVEREADDYPYACAPDCTICIAIRKYQ